MKQKTLKILSISLMVSMVLCCYTGSTISKHIASLEEDEIDQVQDYCDETGIVGNSTEELSVMIAQSFKPGKEMLTKVEIMLAKTLLSNMPCALAIKDNLYGDNLAVTNVSASEIPTAIDETDLVNMSWVEFNFEDIFVDVNETYYIVVYAEPGFCNYFVFGYSTEDVYENGSLYTSYQMGDIVWEEAAFGTQDLCFRTYGADEPQPDVRIESIIGSFSSGQNGIIVSVKNNGGANATDVTVNVTISGGFLGLVNNSASVTFASINISEIKEFQVSAFGLGRVKINATVGDEILAKSGFIIFKRIFILPDFLA